MIDDINYNISEICVLCLQYILWPDANTRESDGERESLCKGLHKLSSSSKLTQVFALGYVNTASILYFFYKINVQHELLHHLCSSLSLHLKVHPALLL